MSDAECWANLHGFTDRTRVRNDRGENLVACLDAEPDVTASGVVEPRGTFPDGSAVVLGQ